MLLNKKGPGVIRAFLVVILPQRGYLFVGIFIFCVLFWQELLLAIWVAPAGAYICFCLFYKLVAPPGQCLNIVYFVIKLYSSSSFGLKTISIRRFLDNASAVVPVSIG